MTDYYGRNYSGGYYGNYGHRSENNGSDYRNKKDSQEDKQPQRKPVKAPYNFIYLCPRPVVRYADISELPCHNVWQPELLSGEIHITMKAQTPVFISNGLNKEEDTVDFFRGADGSYQIPGSSLRGMIRENMQILGFGALLPDEDFQDIHLFYRALANAKNSTHKKVHDRYKDVLGITACQTERKKRFSVADNVKGGYLHHEGSSYYINPVKGSILTVARNSYIAEPWKDRYAFMEPIWYAARGSTVTLISSDKEDGLKRGMLLSPGFMNKQNRLYIFPPEDAESDSIFISETDRLSYAEDYEIRKNTLGGTREEKADKEFWALPRSGECKPVFYVQSGDMVSFGMSQFLRIMYLHGFRHGLNYTLSDPFLDYPHAIMGFAGKEHSYRSRVSCGALKAKGNVKPCEKFQIILAEPKLSFFPAYTVDGKDYNQRDFRMRGYKQYWFKTAEFPPTPEKQNVATWMRPLPEKTCFTGTVRYSNLYPDELGLLLWCLRLQQDEDCRCFQSIGMGKPYGFGRMALTIDKLIEYDPVSLYSADNLCGRTDENTNPQKRIDDLIMCYRNYVIENKLIGGKSSDPADRFTIKDFFYMKSTVREDTDAVSYMELDDYKNVTDPLPTVREIREAAAKK